MSATISPIRKIAIETAGKLAGKSASDDGDWFSKAARTLYPHKAGAILHVTTGLGDERLCHRYASGDTRPPAFFLRALLRSDHGEQWLSVLMDGCTAPWWRDLSDARHLLVNYRIVRREE